VTGSVALAAAFDAAGGATGVRQFEDFTLDLRQQTTAESFQAGVGERASEVVLVMFDEYTVMDPETGWPWISPFPRAHLAELIDALSAAGAKTIGVDVFLDRLFPGLNEIDGGDDLLRSSIARAGNVILVTPVQRTDAGPVSSPPHPFFAEVAAGVGSAELPASFDTFRDATLAVRSGSELQPSFALSLYAHSRSLDADSLLRHARAEGRIDLPGLPPQFGAVPAEWFGPAAGTGSSIIPFRIRYVGPPSTADASGAPGTFQASASGTVPDIALFLPELFDGKVVLMGSGFHSEERFRTPFYEYTHAVSGQGGGASETEPYGWMYGVEVHANALQNMLDGEYVKPMGTLPRLLLLLLVAFIAGGGAFWKGAGWGSAAAAFALIGTGLYAWWAWAGVVYIPGAELFSLGERFTWVPVGAPFLSGAFAYVGSVAYVAVVEGREKRFIKGAFGKYVSPEVVDRISQDPAALKLGGQSRPLSILFSDLRGFTEMSERMKPEALITLLNEYLDDMTAIVLEERGTLDKYIGDAIMAFWNAPTDQKDHALRACRAAWACQIKLATIQDKLKSMGLDAGDEGLVMRIGLNTGPAIAGLMGSRRKLNYTVMGDTVNTASRLEGANKPYGTRIMISAATKAAAGTKVLTRPLDYIKVKGKAEATPVFEIIGIQGEGQPLFGDAYVHAWSVALADYKRGDFKIALEGFLACRQAQPHDAAVNLFIERCDHFVHEAPKDWDGVYTMKTK
jgi:adenylate cyclase